MSLEQIEKGAKTMKGTLKIVVTDRDVNEVSKMRGVVATNEANVYLVPEKVESVLQAKKIDYAVILPNNVKKEEKR